MVILVNRGLKCLRTLRNVWNDISHLTQDHIVSYNDLVIIIEVLVMIYPKRQFGIAEQALLLEEL